ncbi:MAG TPA: hypothetical protein H9804_10525 [Candidatus Mucispirillum faecigallinarum]|uniref:Acyl carrier protein n=1 Tax=Candidatus Mucispirillum faecigallinarum TaxID=2838699 RepID=A0A9D2GX55_9BACT|nr:hypothetical protein [Candidatus Mucispirillum faecigallinarum]
MKDDVFEKISEVFKNYNIDIDNIDKHISLIENNITDSLTFVNILLEIEDTLNVLINFDEIDMDQLVYIDNIVNYIKSIS